MNPHFRFPLKLTIWSILVAVAISILGATGIYFSKMSDRKKREWSALAGATLGLVVIVVVTPFWLVAAGKVGQERRASRTR